MAPMSDLGHVTQQTSTFMKVHGNDCHMFERRQAPLCFVQPYFHHVPLGPEKVLKVPRRMTTEMFEDRGNEALLYAGRRLNDCRRLQFEDKDRIKETTERDRLAREQRNARPQDSLRWWQTRAALEERDLLRTLQAQNGRFKPELLLNAKDIVICNLTGCKLGDEAMNWVSTFVSQNGTLRRLNLQANKITVDGVNNLYAGLRETKSLIDLDISLNPLGDDGLAALVGAFTENMRFTKIQKLNLSTCDLSPSACYHIQRLIRDFPTLEVLLLWRNRLGVVTAGDASQKTSNYGGAAGNASSGVFGSASGDYLVTGLQLILDELKHNTTLLHLDLSCNNIGELIFSQHATMKEQEARQSRLAEIDQHKKRSKIDILTTQVEEMRRTATYEDEKIVLANMEAELAGERARYRQELEQEKAKAKQKKDAETQYRELMKATTGRTLIDVKRKLRIVLAGNPSVQPQTFARLKPFYDLTTVADYEAFVSAPRKFDNIVRSYRRPGDFNAEKPETYNVFDFEDELLIKERQQREARTKEMEELRRKGYDATAILEERLRGVTPGRRARTPSRTNGSNGSRDVTPRGRDGGAADPLSGTLGFTPRHNAGGLTPRGVNRSPRDLFSTPSGAGAALEGSQFLQLPTATAPLGSPAAVDISAAPTQQASITLAYDSGVDSTASTGSQRTGGKRAQRRTKRSHAATDRAVAVIPTSPKKKDPYSITKEELYAKKREEELAAADPEVTTYDDFDRMIAEDAGGAGQDDDGQNDGDSEAFLKLRAMLAEEDDSAAQHQAEMQRKIEAKLAEVRQRIDDRAAAVASSLPPQAPEEEMLEETGEEVVEVAEDGAMTMKVSQDDVVAAASVAEDGSAAASDTATSLFIDGIKAVKRMWAAIRQISERGSPSDDDTAQLHKEQTRVSRFCSDFAAQLAEVQGGIVIPDDAMELCCGFFEDILKSTDRDASFVALAEAMLNVAGIDFPTLCESRGLVALVAADASAQFFQLLLRYPGMRYDPNEVALACFYHQQYRIPLAHIFLTHPSVDLSGCVDDLQPAWQEFFEDIASHKRAIPNEDRSQRDELIKVMLEHPAGFAIDAEILGSDGRTCFTRACAEGDGYVITMLGFNGKIKDVNLRTSPTGLTPLMHAVMSRVTDAVLAVFDLGLEVDVNAVSSDAGGSALTIATMLRCDDAIVSALKEHGAKMTAATGGAAAAPPKASRKPASAAKAGAGGRTTKRGAGK